MKKTLILFLLALSGMWVACDFDSSQTVTYNVNEPVFASAAEFRSSVKVSQKAHELSDYGKICFYNGYLYISEPGKGIHIIDNTDPAHPQIKGYVELSGNQDLAIRNNLLYADALVDLVWFDISNPAQPVLKGRVENLFPEVLPPVENEYGYDYNLCSQGAQKGKIVVGWKLQQRTEKIQPYRGDGAYYDGTVGSIAPNATEKSTSTGISGSMSRFSLYDNYLYAVINGQLNVVDLSGETPEKTPDNIYTGNVETIFSYKDKMFLGTPTGMMIYSVENPRQPVYCSAIWHVFGCDPVVVDNDLAYVTIHSGNFCGQNVNELMVIDVSNTKQPLTLATYNMQNPKGLGIDNGILFLCDDGLKAFKITEPQTLMANQVAHYEGMDGYDVIPFDNTLMMIADNGLYQYDYSDIQQIKPISVIPIKK